MTPLAFSYAHGLTFSAWLILATFGLPSTAGAQRGFEQLPGGKDWQTHLAERVRGGTVAGLTSWNVGRNSPRSA